MSKLAETLKRLPEIKALADASLPGPWQALPSDSYSAYPAVVGGGGRLRLLFEDSEELPGRDEDAQFTAAARTDVPALVEAVEKLVVLVAKAADYLDGEGLDELAQEIRSELVGAPK